MSPKQDHLSCAGCPVHKSNVSEESHSYCKHHRSEFLLGHFFWQVVTKVFKEGVSFSNLYKWILWTADGPGSKDLRVKTKTIKINKMNNSTSIFKFVDKTHITCFSEVC